MVRQLDFFLVVSDRRKARGLLPIVSRSLLMVATLQAALALAPGCRRGGADDASAQPPIATERAASHARLLAAFRKRGPAVQRSAD